MNFTAQLDHGVIALLAGMTRSGEPDLLPMIVSMFLETTPAMLDAITRAAATGDLRTLQRQGHDLKSSSASLGAGIMSSRCAELEALARAGTTDGTVALVSDIIKEFDAVRPELIALLPGPPKQPSGVTQNH